MNQKYDFNSTKYIWLLIIVCFAFFILVIKAFQYLPETSQTIPNDTQLTDNNSAVYNVNSSEDSTNVQDKNDTKDEEASEEYKNNHKSGKIVFDNGYDGEFEEVEAPKSILEEDSLKPQEPVQVSLTKDEQAIKAIANGKRLFREKNYADSLAEYRTVADLTTDNELVAMSYEGMSEIYAISKKYGTALSFAAKAYNTSPSLGREMLIAKIYYKAGNTENAITRVNNLLKREF